MSQCSKCKKVATDGYRYCVKCRDRAKASNARRRGRLRAEGKCTRCGKNQPPDGRKMCDPCVEKGRASQLRWRRDRGTKPVGSAFTATQRTCSRCEETMPLDCFPPDSRNSSGTQSRCRSCINTSMKKYHHDDPVAGMLVRARTRATRKGFDFSITREDIGDLPSVCPALGIPLHPSTGKMSDGSYSLDRIDSSKGYIPGNVAVVSYLANRLKNNATSAQLRAIADWIDSNS